MLFLLHTHYKVSSMLFGNSTILIWEFISYPLKCIVGYCIISLINVKATPHNSPQK